MLPKKRFRTCTGLHWNWDRWLGLVSRLPFLLQRSDESLAKKVCFLITAAWIQTVAVLMARLSILETTTTIG